MLRRSPETGVWFPIDCRVSSGLTGLVWSKESGNKESHDDASHFADFNSPGDFTEACVRPETFSCEVGSPLFVCAPADLGGNSRKHCPSSGARSAQFVLGAYCIVNFFFRPDFRGFQREKTTSFTSGSTADCTEHRATGSDFEFTCENAGRICHCPTKTPY